MQAALASHLLVRYLACLSFVGQIVCLLVIGQPLALLLLIGWHDIFWLLIGWHNAAATVAASAVLLNIAAAYPKLEHS